MYICISFFLTVCECIKHKNGFNFYSILYCCCNCKQTHMATTDDLGDLRAAKIDEPIRCFVCLLQNEQHQYICKQYCTIAMANGRQEYWKPSFLMITTRSTRSKWKGGKEKMVNPVAVAKTGVSSSLSKILIKITWTNSNCELWPSFSFAVSFKWECFGRNR